MLHTATITVTKIFQVDEEDDAFRAFLEKYDIDLTEKAGSADISEGDLHFLLEKIDDRYARAGSINVEFDVRRR